MPAACKFMAKKHQNLWLLVLDPVCSKQGSIFMIMPACLSDDCRLNGFRLRKLRSKARCRTGGRPGATNLYMSWLIRVLFFSL